MTTDEIMSLADTYWGSAGPNMATTRNALQAAIEALQKDAARYRWLRDEESDTEEMFAPGSYNAKYGLVDLGDMLTGADLDATIDAAMALDKP